jgi:hypothetical protein
MSALHLSHREAICATRFCCLDVALCVSRDGPCGWRSSPAANECAREIVAGEDARHAQSLVAHNPSDVTRFCCLDVASCVLRDGPCGWRSSPAANECAREIVAGEDARHAQSLVAHRSAVGISLFDSDRGAVGYQIRTEVASGEGA